MNWIELLNTGLDYQLLGNTVKDYLQSLAVLLGIALGLSIFKRVAITHLARVAKRTVNDFDDFVVTLLAQIGFPVILAIAVYYAVLPLQLSETVRALLRYAVVITVAIRAIFIIQDIVKYGIGKAYRRRVKAPDSSIEFMVASVSSIARWGIWVLGVVFILDNLGINVTTFVAGIGIGGVAVAMASQAILGDAFSAVSIFLDKPFEIGDFIILDNGYMGSVEYIGIKTTRIRSLDGEQLIFSNSDLTKSRIRNYKRMQTRRITFKFGVVYQTPPEKVKLIPALVKEIFHRLKDARLDRVHFQSFGEYALVFETAYYVQSADYNTYMDIQQAVNVSIMEAFEREGITFALPARTVFVQSQEPGPPLADRSRVTAIH